ncbi:protein of unknown function [Actinopolyspora alba]|uniref:DUF397 domain-containing protein n=1 Tax=Actinopolyspora alba TaxID=673379 RepID=A0A1I2CQ99_9ACTN|nr:DUF397 domain-containing protein [Actinopolyspora alba]SFE70418.1 protein of unknown function [Actinopolyspora alba]
MTTEMLRTSAQFRKSSYSSGAQDCVAVGRAGEFAGVQDTKESADSRERTTLAFGADAFGAFVAAVKSGRFG